MANRTLKEAVSVKGTNPQYLVEKIIRTRIYDSRYWKEECFALTAELLVDKAMELRYVGGIYGGNIKPTPFLCLILKMLQIQPEKDIVIEFIKNEDFKYVRALGAFYMRLVGTSMECYKYLEPLLNDYRKLRFQDKNGKFELLHVDEFVDHLLRDERYCDVILPRIQKRHVMEEANEIETRVSALDEDLEAEDSEGSDDEDEKGKSLSPPPAPSISRSREHERERDRDRHREKREDSGRDRDRDRDRRIEYERDRDRNHGRDREREKRRDRDDRDRKRHRSRSKSRDRGDYERSRDKDRDRKDREKEKEKSKKSKDRKPKQETSTEEQEIAEANALRAKLGLAPLRR